VAARALVVFGITGRMGQSLILALREDPLFYLTGAIASAASSRVGLDACAMGEPCGVTVTADAVAALKGGEVAVDFSLGPAVIEHARVCAEAGVPLLVGTTGFDAEGRAALDRAAQAIPVLIAPNTSVGVAVMSELLATAALSLGLGYDVEIFEAHHRTKRDAPSGTALSLGEVVAGARQQRLSDVAIFDRHGNESARKPGSIGFSVLRAGDIVGEHTVTFAAAGERLEITHRATDRITFARGALRAAAWLIGQPKGLYGMHNVLGL
jgi:4-hydroxy-tetrahydrodipicolinate reductase